ncbi:MAG: hypothetical protein AAB858_03040 [Patescibacteria group bacterium]|mgnify:FL=1
MNNRYKLLKSISLGSIVAIIAVTVITIVGELYAPFKDWLKGVFTHHWLGKSALAVIIFIFVSFVGNILFSREENRAKWLLEALLYVALLATLFLMIFFFYHGRS